MQKTDHNESEVRVEENDKRQHDEEAEEAAEQAAPPDGEETGAQQDGPVADDELSVLRAELDRKEAEAKANYELFLRERAELENFKRRMQREKAEALRFAHEPLVRDLLPVVDNLERATLHAQRGGNGQSLVEGVQLVLRSFVDVLGKYGVARVQATGEFFDPAKHEAMVQVESKEFPPNTVVEEHTPGYSLHDRLLRAAMVSVSKAPAAAAEREDGPTTPDKKSED